MKLRQLINALNDWSNNHGVRFQRDFVYGKTLWGTPRGFDVCLQKGTKWLALQYQTQEKGGSAFQKAVADIEDARTTPELRILSVLAGEGIPEAFKAWATRTGFAVREEDLIDYLRFHFELTEE